MLATGWPLSAVEQAIDRYALPADDRDALWLFAWSLARRDGRRFGRPRRRAAG